MAVFAAAVILLLGAPAAFAASTLYVNAATGTDSSSCGASTSPCQTIQQAVVNASDGDTIEVAPGAYPAQPGTATDSLLIDKSVTLRGTQAGNAGSAARASSPASESLIDEHIDITASNVTLDGFSSDYPGTQVFVNGPSGTTIENDVFSGYQPDNYSAYQITSAIGVSAAPSTAITRNYFTSPGATDGAVQFFNGGCSQTAVSDNTFYAAANDGLATIFFYCDDQASADITVSGNHDVHVGDTNGESSLIVEDVNGNVHVTGNTVTASYPSSAFYFTLSPHLGAVDITGNSVVGSASSAITIRPTGGGSGSYTITGNRLSGGKYGLYVYSGALANGATVTLRGNDLAGNSVDGVFNDPGSGGSVDDADNWWGCNAGPAVAGSGCSGFVGDVTYDPWLVLGIPASPSTTVMADVTHDSAGNDASASGTIPDGTVVSFATDFGTLSANTSGTSAGKASVTLTSPTAGTAHVSATLDSQTVSTTVTFLPPPPPLAPTPPAPTSGATFDHETAGAGTPADLLTGDGKAGLHVPGGAFTGDTAVGITEDTAAPSDFPPLPPMFTPAGVSVSVSLAPAATPAAPTVAQTPLSLVLDYTAANLPAGGSAADLEVVRLDTSTATPHWLGVPTVADAKTQTVTASILTGGTYLVVAAQRSVIAETPTALSVALGARGTATFTLTNATTRSETFTAGAAGLASATAPAYGAIVFARPVPATITLAPGATTTVTLAFRAKATGPGGTYSFFLQTRLVGPAPAGVSAVSRTPFSIQVTT